MLEMQEWVQRQIYEVGIIPVIKLKDVDKAACLAQALVSGKIPAAEITFRSEGAEKVIQAMRTAFPDMLVGAGTILTTEQVDLAVDAGAQFIVSPGYDEEVVSYCVDKKIPIFPGCVTPTEIQMALKHGLNVLKFFPASQYGGLETINALAGPFANIKFMPTGGISLKNLEEYISNKHIAACGGSFMVKESLLSEGNWTEIKKICTEAAEIVKKARG